VAAAADGASAEAMRLLRKRSRRNSRMKVTRSIPSPVSPRRSRRVSRLERRRPLSSSSRQHHRAARSALYRIKRRQRNRWRDRRNLLPRRRLPLRAAVQRCANPRRCSVPLRKPNRGPHLSSLRRHPNLRRSRPRRRKRVPQRPTVTGPAGPVGGRAALPAEAEEL
jgi:hypothetical protein